MSDAFPDIIPYLKHRLSPNYHIHAFKQNITFTYFRVIDWEPRAFIYVNVPKGLTPWTEGTTPDISKMRCCRVRQPPSPDPVAMHFRGCRGGGGGPFCQTPRKHLTPFFSRASPLISLATIPINKCTFCHPLGVAGRGNPHIKLLALVIPYSGNTNGTFGTVFSLDVIPINKCTVLPPSIGDFGGNPHRQQRIFEMSGVVPSVHGVKPFGVVYKNKSSGLPVYIIFCD